jgi:predicted nucleotidyltransferase
MPTVEQQHLIDDLRRLLGAEPRVAAAWLAGSLGKGGGDAYSDVDLLVLVGEGAAAETSAVLAAQLSAIVTPVLVNRLHGGRILNVVTDDWRRFDLSLVEPADLARYNAADLTVLFNRGVLVPPTRPEAAYRVGPEQLLALVQEFIRVMGLLPVALGREEYVLGLSGLELLRRMCVNLMLEENGISPAKRGGALHRNPMLTLKQRAELASLPPASADRQSLIAGNRALAPIFLPRARRLADEVGMAWPTELEAAARRYLKATVGLDI